MDTVNCNKNSISEEEIDETSISDNDINELQLRDQLLDETNIAKEFKSESHESKLGNIVIEFEGKSPNLALPPGWIAVNHQSGGIVYLHKESRVVTWSMPYCIGKNSLRKHNVPLFAIPCLHQSSSLSQKAKQKREERKRKSLSSTFLPLKRAKHEINNSHFEIEQSQSNIDGARRPTVDTDIISEEAKSRTHSFSSSSKLELPAQSIPRTFSNGIDCQSDNLCIENDVSFVGDTNPATPNSKSGKPINSEDLNSLVCTDEGRNLLEVVKNKEDFLESLDSREVNVYLSKLFKFRPLSSDKASLPIFHDGSVQEKCKDGQNQKHIEKLKAIPRFSKCNETDKSKNYSVSAAGKTPLEILNEYCQKSLKDKPKFIDSASLTGGEFCVEVEVAGIKYGKGRGLSKKLARRDAANRTLQILQPDEYKLMGDFKFSSKQLQVIDELDIKDPDVSECTKALGLPLPSEILDDCLKRNPNHCPEDYQFSLKPGEKNNPHTYEITCGKYKAKGECKNRKSGKQLASQAILQMIHPDLVKWGQIAKLYCDTPNNLIKETNKVSQDQEISRMLTSDANILKKLKEEMRKLKTKKM